MKRFIILLIISLIAGNISLMAQDKIAMAVKAVKLWESDKVFHIPESVFYDEESDVLYVSNIDGSPVVKDENGFISKMSTDGKIIDLRWITGLNAPKGMGKYQGKLYVSDIDQLVKIDIAKGEIIKRFDAKDALFLNDIAIDEEGVVYVSDMRGNVIYRLIDGEFNKWFEHEALVYPNGLFYQDGALYAGCWDHILKIDPETKSHELFVQETGNIDGLNIDEQGNFIISDFYGKVQCVNSNGEKTVLFNTSVEMINAADIYYVKSSHSLYVPTFRDGRVIAYDIIY